MSRRASKGVWYLVAKVTVICGDAAYNQREASCLTMLKPVPLLRGVLTLVASVLILKVTLSVVLGYRDYFPANFRTDFLQGREDYFYGPYWWAFYTHIVSGPITLILGLLLVSEAFRTAFPTGHRRLGKEQALLVLFLLAPSGLWMARYAQSGPVAAIGFSGLAIATGACVVMGWRAAMKRRFAEHRRWMWRCFLLLSSAVIVRLVGGLATVLCLGVHWIYPLTAWLSWIVPLATYEFVRAIGQRSRRIGGHSAAPGGDSPWLAGVSMARR